MKPPIEYRPIKVKEIRAGGTETPVGGNCPVVRPAAKVPAFDRNAYQREYMRRYRAKKGTK